MVSSMFESNSFIRMIILVHWMIKRMRYKTPNLVPSIWDVILGLMRYYKACGYDHTESHPNISPLLVISGHLFLIIVHVILSYVMSMGIPPLVNIS